MGVLHIIVCSKKVVLSRMPESGRACCLISAVFHYLKKFGKILKKLLTNEEKGFIIQLVRYARD